MGSDAVPALIKALQDDNGKTRLSAASVLGEIGPEAVPALIDALQNGDESLRFSATLVLGDMGPAAKDAVPALVEALRDRDFFYFAAKSLSDIGSDAVPALVDALRNDNVLLRRGAAGALLQLGVDAKDAIPALNKALQEDDNFGVRQAREVPLPAGGCEVDQPGRSERLNRLPDLSPNNRSATNYAATKGPLPRCRLSPKNCDTLRLS